jgi:hypothetical protein
VAGFGCECQRLAVRGLGSIELFKRMALTNCRSIPNFPLPVSTMEMSDVRASDGSMDAMAMCDERPDHAQALVSGCNAAV